MNANVTTGIRELTAQELDVVGGGRLSYDPSPGQLVIDIFTVGGLVGMVVGGLIDWLFG